MDPQTSYSLYADPWTWVIGVIALIYAVTLCKGLWLWFTEEKSGKKDREKKE